MKTPHPAPTLEFIPYRRDPLSFREQTGQSGLIWFVMAVFTFALQILFCRQLAAGEYGTLNTALGFIGMMCVPVLALQQTISNYLAQPPSLERHAPIRTATPIAVETLGWIWGALSIVIMLQLLPFLGLPRWAVTVLAFNNVLIALGVLSSRAVSQQRNDLRAWAVLLVFAACVRLVIGDYFSLRFSTADMALMAYLIGGIILLKPVISKGEIGLSLRISSCRLLLTRDFIFLYGVTFCLMAGLFFFTSADRIVAQGWFGVRDKYNMGHVDWTSFDGYQAAGVLGRSLIWGLQPLLIIFYAKRSALTRTTPGSLRYLWIYLGLLFVGSLMLGFCRDPLAHLFCGPDYAKAAYFLPSFGLVMLPVGILQALGTFALASRRYVECYVLGGCGFGYFLLLWFAGRQPELMISYIFGGTFLSIVIVLLVGIVRWGRQHP